MSEPSERRSYRLGVDVGGTKCLGVVIDGDGEIVVSDRRPTPHGGEQLVATVVELAATLGAEVETIASVGVGLPGSITVDGVLTSSPHLPGVVHFDAAARLSERLERPVKVTNDASCAALAEWQVGAGRGVDDLIMITLGTGIGGGVIADGRLLLGAHGYLGEFGHMMIDPARPAVSVRQTRMLGALRVRFGDCPRGQTPGRLRGTARRRRCRRRVCRRHYRRAHRRRSDRR